MEENRLGEKIKQLAGNKNLSIGKLESKAGLRRGMIRDIVVGNSKNPTMNTLIKIWEVLECSPNELFGYNDTKGLQKQGVLTGMESYANAGWKHELFAKCTEMVQKYLNKYELDLGLSKVFSLIADLYLHSLLKNNGQIIDESAAEWLIEKIKVHIPINLQD